MPSATSFFSKALFIKNMQRFWPVLFGYTIAVIFALAGQLINLGDWNMPDSFGALVFPYVPFWVGMIPLAVLTVNCAVWHYLYKPQSTAMINALPVNRKTVFYSNYLSGLFLLLVPIILAAVIYLIAGASLGLTGIAFFWQWLLILVAVTVLLHSLASALAMTTGNLPTLVVLFAVANCLLIFLEFMVRNFLNTYLYGIMSWFNNDMIFACATPVYWLADATAMFRSTGSVSLTAFVVYLLLGLALMALTAKLYQRRRMERATDVMAIRALYPLFIYGVALCSSLSFGSLLAEILVNPRSAAGVGGFIAHMLCFIFTGAIGYFAAQMLVHKSFRVFNLYKGALVYSLILFVAGCSVYYDFYGYAEYTPDPERVAVVAFATGNSDYYTRANMLTALPDRGMNLDSYPHIPAELALRIGTPIAEFSLDDGEPIYYNRPSPTYEVYSDNGRKGYSYPRQEYSLLNDDDLKWLWENTSDLYTSAEGIAAVAELQGYINDNLSPIKASYRQSDRFTTVTERLYIGWRLDNGKVIMRAYPLEIVDDPVAATGPELVERINAIMSSEENVSKLLDCTQLPPQEITSIHIGMHNLYHNVYEKFDDKYSDKYSDYVTSVAPMATTREVYYEDGQEVIPYEIDIMPEHYAPLLAAAAADMRAAPRYVPAFSRLDYSSFNTRVEWMNPELPANNLYANGGKNLSAGGRWENTMSFLHDNGYLNPDFYRDILQYYDAIDEAN